MDPKLDKIYPITSYDTQQPEVSTKEALEKKLNDIFLEDQRVYITQLNFQAVRELKDGEDMQDSWHIEIPHWEHSVEFVLADSEDNQAWVDDIIWPGTIYDTIHGSLGLSDFETANSFIPFYNDFELMILADEFYSVGQIKLSNILHTEDDENKVDFYMPYWHDYRIDRNRLAKKALNDSELLGPLSLTHEKPVQNQFSKDWSDLIANPCQEIDIENWFGPLVVSPDYFASWFQPTSAAPALFMQRDDILIDTFTDLTFYLSISSLLLFLFFLFYRLHGLIFWLLDSLDQEDLLNLRVVSGKDYQRELNNIKNIIVSVEVFFFYIGIFFFILSLFYIPITLPIRFKRNPFDFDTTKVTATANHIPAKYDFDFFLINKAFNNRRRYWQYKKYQYKGRHNVYPWDTMAFTEFREDDQSDPNFFAYRQGFEAMYKVRKKYETAYDTLFNDFALDPITNRSVLFNTLITMETRAINMSTYMIMKKIHPAWYENIFWQALHISAHTYEWCQLYNKDASAFERKYNPTRGRFTFKETHVRKNANKNLIIQQSRTYPPERYNTFEMSYYRELTDPEEYDDGFADGILRPGTLLNENVTKSSSFKMLRDGLIIWIKQLLLDIGFYKKPKKKTINFSIEKKLDLKKQNAIYSSLLFEEFVKNELGKFRPNKQYANLNKIYANYKNRWFDFTDNLSQGDYGQYIDYDIIVRIKREIESQIRFYKKILFIRDERKHHKGFGTEFGIENETSTQLDLTNINVPFTKINKVAYDAFLNLYGDLPITDYFTEAPLMHMRKKRAPFDEEIQELFQTETSSDIIKPYPFTKPYPYLPYFFEFTLDRLDPPEVDIRNMEEFSYWMKNQIEKDTSWSIPYYATPSAVTTTTPRIWKEYTPWSFLTDVYFVTKFPRPYEIALHHRTLNEPYLFKPLNFSFEYSPSINPNRRFKYKPSSFDILNFSNKKNLAVHETIEAAHYANDPKKFLGFLEFLRDNYNLPPQPSVIKTRIPERQFFVPQLLNRLGFFDSRLFIVPMQLYEDHRRHIIALIFFSVLIALVTGRDVETMNRQQYEAMKAQMFIKAWKDRYDHKNTASKLWLDYEKNDLLLKKKAELEKKKMETRKNSLLLGTLKVRKKFPYVMKINDVVKTRKHEIKLRKVIFRTGVRSAPEKFVRYLGIFNATIGMTRRRFVQELINEYEKKKEPIPERLLKLRKKLFNAKKFL